MKNRIIVVLSTALLWGALASAEDCVTIRSAQPLHTRSGRTGNTFSIEVPVTSNPQVAGTLATSLGVSGADFLISFDIPADTLIQTQTDVKQLTVCLVVAAKPKLLRTTEITRSKPVATAVPGAASASSTGASTTGGNAASPQSATVGSADPAALDLSTPESPAFTVLGLTPETVVRPSSPGELASTLINGFDQNGNYQTGVAIDTTPYLLLAGGNITLAKYRESRMIQALSRLQFSVATTKGTSDSDKAVRASLGVRLTLWDRGDPRLDTELSNCMAQSLEMPPPLNPLSASTNVELLEQELELKAQACRTASQKRNWNKSSFVIAGAPAWISPDGLSKNFRLDGGGLWTSFAWGFENVPGLDRHAQLIFHARYRNNETVPDPRTQGAFLRQNSTTLGGRFRFGLPTLNGNFEGVYVNNRPTIRPRETYTRYTVGAEKRLANNLWLSVSFSRDAGRNLGDNNMTFFSNIKWNFLKAPKMQVAQQ